MRIIYFIVAIILFIYSASQLYKYVPDYSIITNFGKGLVWGSGFLFLLSMLFFYFSFRKKKK